ncbi:MAG: DUF1501 domain-containing protein [Pseudomonadota bacterium]|nr:DUF1501 domain-containing protein [Pseudomonadota bacterium]
MTALPGTLARRAFLQRLGHLGVAGVAAPWALNLAAMGEAAAQSASGDYKALVCIFLYGGNDHANTVIPYDSTSHAAYIAARGGGEGLGTARHLLKPLSTKLPDGRELALAPELAPLADMFNSGNLAVQLNVGPLVQPTTREEYRNRSVPLPPRLFSHNDQQSIWQSSAPEGSTVGWGGKLGDLAMGSNTHTLFTCMSVTGNAVFLSGQNALAFQIGAGGARAIGAATNASSMFGSETCRAALNSLITQNRSHVLEHELNTITGRAIDAEATLRDRLAGSATEFDDVLPNNIPYDGQSVGSQLNRQLKMVARLIAARQQLGMQRQVFLVSMGGFDNHDNLGTIHPRLLSLLAQGMQGFQRALNALGVAQGVTTFTASEFGRTITSNGDGSDHGWGAHHFVMGGAVNGKAIYGDMPADILGNELDVGRGNTIPTTSVDAYAATLSEWFGVSKSYMPYIAPNLKHFSPVQGKSFLG